VGNSPVRVRGCVLGRVSSARAGREMSRASAQVRSMFASVLGKRTHRRDAESAEGRISTLRFQIETFD
jgi:hypothetical protein